MAPTSQPSRDIAPRDRILATALATIHAEGLTVSLDHLRLEQVIKDSGVSRATAYRIWPNKRAFLTDVILEAVATTTLTETTARSGAAFAPLLAQREQFFTDEETRRHIVVNAIRMILAEDINALATSQQWTTYLALTVTARGLDDETLRTALTTALAETDTAFTRRRAEIFALLPDMIGYRLTPPLTGEGGFQLLSDSAGALMNGLLIKAVAQPDLLTNTFQLAAFGAGPLEWTVPSYALTSHLLSFIEPDPHVSWDADQRARFEAGLTRVFAETAGVDHAAAPTRRPSYEPPHPGQPVG